MNRYQIRNAKNRFLEYNKPKEANYPKETNDPNGILNQFLCFITTVSLLGNALALLTILSTYITTSELPRYPIVELVKTTEKRIPRRFQNLLLPIIVTAAIEFGIIFVYVAYHSYKCTVNSVGISGGFQSEQWILTDTNNNTLKINVKQSCFGDSTFYDMVLLISFFYGLWACASIAQGCLLLICIIEFHEILTDDGRTFFKTMLGTSIATGIISGFYAFRSLWSRIRLQDELKRAAKA